MIGVMSSCVVFSNIRYALHSIGQKFCGLAELARRVSNVFQKYWHCICYCSFFSKQLTVHPMATVSTTIAPLSQPSSRLASSQHSQEMISISEIAHRRMPPTSAIIDTMIGFMLVRNRAGEIFRVPRSEHLREDDCHSYADSSIIGIYPLVDCYEVGGQAIKPCEIQREPEFEIINRNPTFEEARGYSFCITLPKIYVEYTRNSKAIIQQQAARGCGPAAAAMLIVDHYGIENFPQKCFDFNSLRCCSLSNDEDLSLIFQRANVNVLTRHCSSIDQLQREIQNGGSAIVSVDSGLGGHYVVVDEISQSGVRIRDPFHGWEVLIKKADFERSWGEGDIIQVVS